MGCSSFVNIKGEISKADPKKFGNSLSAIAQKKTIVSAPKEAHLRENTGGQTSSASHPGGELSQNDTYFSGRRKIKHRQLCAEAAVACHRLPCSTEN
jgi:hypothetical protein